ncbi:MAG: hypothetical protein GWN00_35160, partial [Aliifodinibius sp.]|nr:hypothetical protein [Fodinibius sp.]NIV15892.1 hypothetical protein [Fodinibius sp.]NIY29839.1 hypothetical protein [Fodinibius sp.]
LYAGCTDLGFAGWDIYYGHGIIDVHNSLSISNYGYVEIQSPSVNDGIAVNQIPIIGTAFSPNLISYSLKYGIGKNPNEWDLIIEAYGNQVVGDTLAVWNTSALTDTVYTIELRLRQYNYQDIVYRSRVHIDHTAPILNNLTQTEMLIGSENAVLINFTTDDLTLAVLHYGSSGSNDFNCTKTSQYFQKRHYILLSQNDLSGPVDYYIRLENSSGITTIDDNIGDYYQVYISNAQPVENIFSFKEEFSFSGYLLPFVTDFNLNQKPEIVISRRLDTTQYGPLQVWESQNQQFELKSQIGFSAIPRDVGDIDNDDSIELLAGLGGTSMILAIGEGSQFPSQIAWIDTSNIWGSRLVNLDDDQTLELLAIRNEVWSIFDLT